MANRLWVNHALNKLRQGKTVKVQPRGDSMKGRINDGDTVTITPAEGSALESDDIVLVRIQGRRYQHIVLHQILNCDGQRFLIGSAQGRVDGWVEVHDIFGKVTAIEPTDQEGAKAASSSPDFTLPQ